MFRWNYWEYDNFRLDTVPSRGRLSSSASLPPLAPTSEMPMSEDEHRWKEEYGVDLSPECFQNYLLDLVTLTGIYTPVGHYKNEGETPVANWLRTQGVTLYYEDTEFLEARISHERADEDIAIPEYLYRYLILLSEDTFPEEVVHAYQALALLSYIITTERYLARGS